MSPCGDEECVVGEERDVLDGAAVVEGHEGAPVVLPGLSSSYVARFHVSKFQHVNLQISAKILFPGCVTHLLAWGASHKT